MHGDKFHASIVGVDKILRHYSGSGYAIVENTTGVAKPFARLP